MTTQPPPLSIIIPTFNRAPYLLHTVGQVLGQDFAAFELFVIDQSDEAQAAEVQAGLAEHATDPRVHYLRLSSSGVANARNEGLARARGGIILFLDDDVILLKPDFLRAHLRVYEDPAIGGVTGRTVERVNRENTRRTANRITAGGRTLVNLQGLQPCIIHSLKGANMSVRAAAIHGIGGFDRNYTGTALLEEADFSERILRQGWRLWFEPAAELLHLSAPAGGVRVQTTTLTDYYRFRSTAYFVRKHRGRLGLLPFLAVHAAVAAIRSLKTRNPRLPLTLIRGIADGIRRFHQGPRDTLPPTPAPPASGPSSSQSPTLASPQLQLQPV